MSQERPKILFVDDEPAALAGLKLTQGKQFDVRTAESGEQGLALLDAEPDIAIVVSDMQMPEMDGATFLATVKQKAPDAVRLLLTGHADMEAAARAVNEGRIFRFLTKPCSPQDMRLALAAALEMHELMTAERVLLQKTLVGSVKAVVNVLGLTNPEALGRAMRIKSKTRLAARNLSPKDRWGVEFAALFSQIAAASLPEEIVRRLYGGAQLSSAETAQLAAAIDSIKTILSEIPRLEPVTQILSELIELARQPQSSDQVERRAEHPARLLQAVIDLEALESSGQSLRQAVAHMRRRERVYDAATLEALTEMVEVTPEHDVTGMRPTDLKVGMVLAEDLRTTDGLLLLPRGFELTRSSCSHIVDRFAHCLPERVRVHVAPDGGRSSTPAAS